MMKYIPMDQNSLKGCCCHLNTVIFFQGISSSLIESLRRIFDELTLIWAQFSHVFLFHEHTFSFNWIHPVFYIRYFRFFKILWCLLKIWRFTWNYRIPDHMWHDSKFEIVSVKVNRKSKIDETSRNTEPLKNDLTIDISTQLPFRTTLNQKGTRKRPNGET